MRLSKFQPQIFKQRKIFFFGNTTDIDKANFVFGIRKAFPRSLATKIRAVIVQGDSAPNNFNIFEWNFDVLI